MNTEQPLKSDSIEKEVGALKLLFKRQPVLCFLVVLWLVSTTVYAGYQIIQVHNLERENSDLQKKLEDTERERDAKASKLEPFLAEADLRFPDDPSDKRLELLLQRFEKTVIEFDGATKRKGPDRLLLESARERTIERLKRQQSLKVNITSVLGDTEAYSLAEQIKTVFLDAGWPVSKGSVRLGIFYKPQRGCKFYFAEKPNPEMQEAILAILDSIGEKQKLFVDPQQSDDTLEIVVGSK
jgi:hypothetical protein